MMKKIPLFLVMLALLLSQLYSESGKTSAQLVEEANRLIKTISVTEARRMIYSGSIYIIDVRGKDEYAGEHLPGSVNVPRGLLEFVIPSVVSSKDAAVLVYCKKGGRAALAAQTLQIMGYTNVSNLQGGIEAWIAAEMPLQKS